MPSEHPEEEPDFCTRLNCEARHLRKGLCADHYQKQQKKLNRCSLPGCGQPPHPDEDLCTEHFLPLHERREKELNLKRLLEAEQRDTAQQQQAAHAEQRYWDRVRKRQAYATKSSTTGLKPAWSQMSEVANPCSQKKPSTYYVYVHGLPQHVVCESAT